jgi:hypothetical protein
MKVAALHIPSRHCARLGAPFGPVVFVARAVCRRLYCLGGLVMPQWRALSECACSLETDGR